MSSAALMTADELLQLRIPDKHVELVRGVLVVREPSGSTHGLVTMRLGAELAVSVKRTGAGGGAAICLSTYRLLLSRR
jgi:hypothetical protein